jgi:hypothetical protein
MSFTVDLTECFEKINLLRSFFTIFFNCSKYDSLSAQLTKNSLFLEETVLSFWKLLRLLLSSFKNRSISKLLSNWSRKLIISFINMTFCNRVIETIESIMCNCTIKLAHILRYLRSEIERSQLFFVRRVSVNRCQRTLSRETKSDMIQHARRNFDYYWIIHWWWVTASFVLRLIATLEVHRRFIEKSSVMCLAILTFVFLVMTKWFQLA